LGKKRENWGGAQGWPGVVVQEKERKGFTKTEGSMSPGSDRKRKAPLKVWRAKNA